MMIKQAEYLPVKAEDGRIGFKRKLISDLTEKDKEFLRRCEEHETMVKLAQVRQDPVLMEMVKAYLSDDPSEWFAVEGTQLNEA